MVLGNDDPPAREEAPQAQHFATGAEADATTGARARILAAMTGVPAQVQQLLMATYATAMAGTAAAPTAPAQRRVRVLTPEQAEALHRGDGTIVDLCGNGLGTAEEAAADQGTGGATEGS